MTFDEIRAQGAADIFAALGTPATYTPPGGSAVDVTVIIDHDVEVIGEYAQMSDRRTVISIQLSEVQAPKRVAELVVGGTRYSLDQRISHDGVITRWTVINAS